MKKLALLPLLILSMTVHADEREWLPYKTLVEDRRLDKFYAIPAAERDKINLFVTVYQQNKSIKPADVTVTLVDGAERHPLSFGSDHRLAIAFNPKWLADDARIMTSLPKSEKSTMGWDITTPLPDGLQWSYAPVMASVQQSNYAIKKMAGALSMFAPTINMVVLKFAKPAQLRIEAKDGAKVYSSDAKNQIKLKPNPAWLKENPLMVASERPFEAELDSD